MILENIPEGFHEGRRFIVNDFFREYPKIHSNSVVNGYSTSYRQYFEYYIILEEFFSQFGQTLPEILDLDLNDKAQTSLKIVDLLKGLKITLSKEDEKSHLDETRSHYATAFKNQFAYEFTQGDYDRIQALLNELRELISKSELFEAKHQRRLLMKLEKLQAELHKKVSDIDKFWGLVGDAGIAIGKFGKDAKPFVDRMREITGIIWRTQAKTEELPSDTQMPRLEEQN